MAILTKLKTINVDRPNTYSVDKSPRDRVLEALSVQIGLCDATIKGEEFTIERRRYIKGGEGRGHVEKRPASPTPWWFEKDGTFFVQVRFGNKAIPLHPSKPAHLSVEAGKGLDNVRKVLDLLKQAMEAGELDQTIEDRHAEMSAQRRKTEPKAAA